MTSTSERSAQDRKKHYKQSLNLPQTGFQMKAQLGQNEPVSRRRWEDSHLYGRLMERRADAPPFVFHDGPPYANGSIHVGHLLNKVLKDLVVRSRNLAGLRCPFTPGWDCHGLPIEHKVVSELAEKGKLEKLEQLPDDQRRMAIRKACAAYAEKYQKLQAEQMQRLLTLADYDDPYLTMRPGYEAGVLEVFAEMVAQGLVYRDLKPVHWSIANQTALAEAELEYRDREDPSVTVGFDAADPAAVARAFGLVGEGLERPAFTIWTTTPWTLPANLLIAVHDDFEYALVQGRDRTWVVAAELAGRVWKESGLGSPTILAKARGRDLLGLAYRHPFVDRAGRIVGADYVTLEDGTGLVHTAPGHGQEDFQTGQREGETAYCPVRGDGTYDDTVPEWLRGLSVWDANPRIAARLRESGHLLHETTLAHSYPHDWRSKTPVIFRSTEQWFVAVDRPTPREGRSLRDLALAAADESIAFHPTWGRNRFRGMLESRPDWCISRQRSWGLPIPAFRTPTGKTFLTERSVRAVAAVFEREGSDAWFTREPEHLLQDWDPAADPDAPEGVRVAALEKTYDIFDVWFESGSSWNAAVRRRDQGFPVELYLEGSDQHRGWFQLSLLPALGATGRSPFNALLTHGFVVDRNGHKMSKSLGNALEVEDLLQSFGADVCRWWVSSLAYESDIKVDLAYFETAGESYRKVRNTLRFLLGNLGDFPAGAEVDPASIPARSPEAWVLERLGELRARVLAAYDGYQFRQAHLALFDFCNDTLSSFYLQAVKDRLYCDPAGSERRRRTQTALRHLGRVLVGLLAPILPHTADEAWAALEGDDAESVHLQTFPAPPELGADPAWAEVLATRERVLKALEEAKPRRDAETGETGDGIENPLDAGVVVPDPNGILAGFAADLPDVFGVSRVETDPRAARIEIRDLRGEPRCERSWRRDETVRLRADGGWLSDRDAEAVGIGS